MAALHLVYEQRQPDPTMISETAPDWLVAVAVPAVPPFVVHPIRVMNTTMAVPNLSFGGVAATPGPSLSVDWLATTN